MSDTGSPSIDPDEVTAIDVHVHVHASVRGGEVNGELFRQMGNYFHNEAARAQTVPDIADYYRTRNIAAVVFLVDVLGKAENDTLTNEEIAQLAADNADVLIPFASIDPARGAAGVAMARRLITEHRVRGFKFHPAPRASIPTTGRFTRCTS